jgi:hypothetical protein
VVSLIFFYCSRSQSLVSCLQALKALLLRSPKPTLILFSPPITPSELEFLLRLKPLFLR